MGEVWRALDEQRGEPVALKVLFDLGGDAAPRFLREARVLGELRHPGIVGYVAHGAEEDGTHWLAMDWLDGIDLAKRLERGSLGVVESVTVARRIAHALGAAHARGIVHRDVKPSNVFLPAGRSAEAMLVDFGIARVLSASRVVTRAGVAIGTPGYMAPEQARGTGTLDARADVFALGCILFECLAGVPVFTAETLMGLLAKILFEPVPRLTSVQSGIPAVLDDLVARLLSKDPDDRPRDGAEVAAALEGLEGELATDELRPSSAAQARPPALTGRERRIVSVLAVAGGAGPEPRPRVEEQVAAAATAPFDATLLEAAPLGAGPYAQVQAVLGTVGGTLERLADGSLIWALVTQGTATDQAVRAARAALRVRESLPSQAIAIATGWAEAGGAAPMGEAIDRVVALVRGAAVRPPDIALDEVTADLVRSELSVRRGPGAMALLGQRVDDPSGATLLGREAPFVGRERDLAALEGLVIECAAESEACAILIVAPPGAGKSRLRRALAARLAQGQPDLQVLVGAPDGLDEAAAYGVVAALLRKVVRGPAGATLVSRIAERLGPGPEAGWTAAILAEVAGERSGSGANAPLLAARADPRLWGDLVHGAVLAWLSAELGRGPLLLVLEDLHAADRASVELAGAALRAFADRPFCVLGVGRPELRARFPELWSGRRPTVLEIPPLSRRAAREFVRRVLGEAAAGEVVERLVEQAEGSPFALEELVRARVEGRADVPPTLIAMVHSRLDALEPSLRRTLRAASILGQTATLEAIGALVGGALPAADVRAAVDELVQRDLLAWEATGPGGEDAACFPVAAVREAAYASLTEHDRVLGHRLAGDWLEREGRGEAESAAEHFLRAGEPARALRGLTQGAARALAANDLARAALLCDRAIETGAQGRELGGVLVYRSLVCGWRGDVRGARDDIARALALLPPHSEPWCWAAGQEVLDLVRSGDAEGANDRARAILESLDEGDPPEPVRILLAKMCEFLRAVSPGPLPDRLVARAEKGLPAGGGSPSLRARLALARARDGRRRAVPLSHLADWAEAVQAFEDMHDRRSALHTRTLLELARAAVGRPEGAVQQLEAVIAEAEAMSLAYIAAAARHVLATVLSDLGEYEVAIAHSRAALEQYQRGDERMNGGTRVILARALGRGGRLEEAESEARHAIERIASIPGLLSPARAVLAEILLSRGELARALEEATESRRIFDELPDLEWGEWAVRRVHAEVLGAAGRDAEAARAAAEARAALEVCAATIPDSAERAAFLCATPDHAWFFRR